MQYNEKCACFMINYSKQKLFFDDWRERAEEEEEETLKENFASAIMKGHEEVAAERGKIP